MAKRATKEEPVDGHRFDAITRAVATGGTSRRSLLKLMAGSATAGLLALVGVGAAEAAPCRSPNARCGKGKNSICTDLSSDEANCGACGNACGTGQMCCNGTCVDPSDRCNCGACGNTCAYNTNTGEGEACLPYDPTTFELTGYQCWPAILCPNHCSGLGACDQDIGVCHCLVPGASGVDCSIYTPPGDGDCTPQGAYERTCVWPCYNDGQYCSSHGVCNVETNTCECAPSYGGEACEVDLCS